MLLHKSSYNSEALIQDIKKTNWRNIINLPSREETSSYIQINLTLSDCLMYRQQHSNTLLRDRRFAFSEKVHTKRVIKILNTTIIYITFLLFSDESI